MKPRPLPPAAVCALALSTVFASLAAAGDYRTTPLPEHTVEAHYTFEQKARFYDVPGQLANQTIKNTQIIYTLTRTGEGGRLEIKCEGSPDKDALLSATVTMDDKASVLEDVARNGDEKEQTIVKTETVQFMGKGKTIVWKKLSDKSPRPKKDGKERDDDENGKGFIDADEIVTTLFQMPVWAATVRDVPEGRGVPFRLCLQGEPIQMRLTKKSDNGNKVVYACERAGSKRSDDDDDDKDKDTLFKITFDKNEFTNGFALPTKVSMHVGRTSIAMVRKDG